MIDKIENTFRKTFANGLFKSHKTNIDVNNQYFRVGVVGDLSILNYAENDPAIHDFRVIIDKKDGSFVVECFRGGSLYIYPREGSFNAMDTIKIGFRKFKAKDEAELLKKFDKYFKKFAEVVRENKNVIYNNDKIEKYLNI